MQPVGGAGAVLTQGFAGARQVPQVADRRRGHEAAPHEPVLYQWRDPHAVLHVRFPPGDPGDVRGIGEEARDRLFEDVEHRLPVHARALHRGVGHALRLQPLAQREQLRDRRAEGPHLLPTAAPRARHADTHRHRLLVHVEPREPLQHLVHRPPPRARWRRRPPEHPRRDFARRAHGPQCGVPEAPAAIYLRTRGTRKIRRLRARDVAGG